MLWQLPFVVSVALVALGLYICIVKTNMVKIVMGVALMESGANLFLVALGYRENGTAPIFYQNPNPGAEMVMPTTQALTLTSIVIGVATTALLLAFTVMLYKRYGTVDTRRARRLRE